eukprot:359938-Chlamydomonas_euryale.AAC.12
MPHRAQATPRMRARSFVVQRLVGCGGGSDCRLAVGRWTPRLSPEPPVCMAGPTMSFHKMTDRSRMRHGAAGNFNTVAIECLQRMNNNESKFTIACDGHTFNFLTWNGFSECMQQPQQQQKGSHASERCACLQTCSCQLIWFHVCQENHGWRTAF